jgi:hypothetical protein
VAVAAPYDDVNGYGIVYIFCGGSNGLNKKPDQVSFQKSNKYEFLSSFKIFYSDYSGLRL